eukprot:TRINITY_DN18721_c0_g1_i1.p1 TRINITY_DN18721_c0_g1~~TRINITY_DN18721_c0_g1_i1.p1  ORF type:complete len:222 (+),score=39.27 TRINITY_DN18721_c0_g1_i1:39-704(+)
MLRRSAWRLAAGRPPPFSGPEVKALKAGREGAADLEQKFQELLGTSTPQGVPVLKGSGGAVQRRRQAQRRKDRVAVLIDFCRPNIAAESVPVVLKAALALGTPDVRRAYADYTGNDSHRFQTAAANGFDMVHVHKRVKTLNKPAPSHIRMAVDLAELAHKRPLRPRHVVIACDISRAYQFLSPLLHDQGLWLVVNSFDPSLSCRRIGQIHATTGELLEPSY